MQYSLTNVQLESNHEEVIRQIKAQKCSLKNYIELFKNVNAKKMVLSDTNNNN